MTFWGVSWPWTPAFNILFFESLSYQFYLGKVLHHAGKVLFVTTMFLDGWEKLLLEDVFVSLKSFLLKLTGCGIKAPPVQELAQEWQQAV